MDSTGKDYRFSMWDRFWTWRKVRDNEHLNIVSCKWLTEDSPPDLVFILIGANFLDHVTQVWISVGVAMSKVDCVIIIYSSKDRALYDGLLRFSLTSNVRE